MDINAAMDGETMDRIARARLGGKALRIRLDDGGPQRSGSTGGRPSFDRAPRDDRGGSRGFDRGARDDRGGSRGGFDRGGRDDRGGARGYDRNGR